MGTSWLGVGMAVCINVCSYAGRVNCLFKLICFSFNGQKCYLSMKGIFHVLRI